MYRCLPLEYPFILYYCFLCVVVVVVVAAVVKSDCGECVCYKNKVGGGRDYILCVSMLDGIIMSVANMNEIYESLFGEEREETKSKIFLRHEHFLFIIIYYLIINTLVTRFSPPTTSI